MATDYAAVLAVMGKGSKKWTSAGIGDEGYNNLVRTWTDAEAMPTRVAMDAAWPAVEADIALIDDMPTKEELDDVTYGDITGAPADAIVARRTAAKAARLRIP